MSITEMIDKIIKIENRISSLYDELYNLEKKNDKSGCMYSHHLNELKDALKEEEAFFANLNYNEFMNLKEHINDIEEALKNRNASNHFSNLIMFRIEAVINYYFVEECSSNNEDEENYFNEMHGSQKKSKVITDVVYDEFHDLYLSFLDEEIALCGDARVKNDLIYVKYSYVFVQSTCYSKKVANRDFNTESSLFIGSAFSIEFDNLFSIKFEKLDLNEFYCKKNCLSLILIADSIKKFTTNNIFNSSGYKNPTEIVDTIIFLIKMRACFLLMDNETFKIYIDDFARQDDLCNKINDVFGIDIIKVLKKDRGRHKYLSLKRE